MHEILHSSLTIWMQWVEQWGYWGVALLMAMESSILPVPSEVVVPPAAILATQPGSGMSFWGVTLMGTLGSWIGSSIMYALSLWVGRPFILRYGRYFFMPAHKVETAENFMQRYSVPGIFLARFLPVVRHLISIPAGLARVNFLSFSVVTVLGSAIWCAVLAWFGDKVGRDHPDILHSPDELMNAVRGETWLIIAAICLLVGLYVLMRCLARKRH